MNNVRWVLLGHGPFSYRVLESAIAEGWAPVEVFTVPEPSDLEPQSMSDLAEPRNIPISFADPNHEGAGRLSALQPDVLVAVNYPRILTPEALGTAEVALNVHGSLLPQLRGRAPLTWAIIRGFTETGVTVHLMEPTVDTGAIVRQHRIPIRPDDTVASIQSTMLGIYPELVRDAIYRVGEGRLAASSQSGEASYGERRRPEDGRIDWNWNSIQIFNWVRALTRPYPGAFTVVDDDRVRVWKVSVSQIPTPRPAGRVLAPALTVGVGTGWVVACGDGVVTLVDFDDPEQVLRTGVDLQ